MQIWYSILIEPAVSFFVSNARFDNDVTNMAQIKLLIM